MQESRDLIEQEIDERAERFIAKFQESLLLEGEAEISEQPKSITRPDKGKESVRPKIVQLPTFHRQRQFVSKYGFRFRSRQGILLFYAAVGVVALVLLLTAASNDNDDKAASFFLCITKTVLYLVGGAMLGAVAWKLWKAVLYSLELLTAASNANKVSYPALSCSMLLVLYAGKNASGFMALFYCVSALGMIAKGRRLRIALDPQRTSYSLALFNAVGGPMVLIIGVLFQAALDAIAAPLVLFIGAVFQVALDAAENPSIIHIIAGMALCLAVLAVVWKLVKLFHRDERLKLLFRHYEEQRRLQCARLVEDIDTWLSGGSLENSPSRPVQEDQKLLQDSTKLKEPGKSSPASKQLRQGHTFTSDNELTANNSESAGEPKDSLSEAQLQQSVDLERFIEKFQDGLRLKAEPESSKQPKAIPRPEKGEESVRPEIEQYPTFDGQRQFISKCGLGLTESPDAEAWYDAEIIDLMDNELSNLPHEPMCPKLYTLSLRENYKLRKIPSTFFTNMPLLQFLDLSNTSIMSLPKSVFELAHLKRLYLMKCEFLMVLPPEVGKLKRLVVLDMEGTEIFNLPVEIQELSVLRRLRVSLYGCIHQDWQSRQSNSMIPFGVISALSTLQEVNIGINPDDERWDACVETIMKEVCDLSSLKTLMFYFPKVELLRDLEMISPSLSDFRFIVGRHSKSIIPRLPSNVELELERLGLHNRCLKYINGEGVPEDIKKVLKHATAFQLDRHMTVKKLTEFGIENMEHLKGCLLGECNEMQVIIDGNDIHNGQTICESSGDRRIGLESLEFLYIYYMKNLKSIWEGPVDESSLSLLKSLTLSTCPQLITIFSVELLENLHNLEELTVRDCPAIKSLVSCKEGSKQSASYLPELRTISLYYVPNLVSISSEVWFAPELREMSLCNCPKLKSLSIKEVSSKHLEKITGETDWWEALEWKQVQRGQFDRIFVPINSDTCF